MMLKLADFINYNIISLPFGIGHYQLDAILKQVFYRKYKYDSAFFIENCCTINGKPFKLNPFQKEICKMLDKRIKGPEQLTRVEEAMKQFIEECLKPSYYLQWLKTIEISNELQRNILFLVAYFDKRLF